LKQLNHAQLFKDLEKLAGSFGPTFGRALSGVLKGSEIFTQLSADFNKQFVGGIQKDIGRLLGDAFKGPFRQAIEQAKQIIVQQQIAGTLFGNIESGMLAKQINDALNAAIPGLEKITGGDIFDLQDANKLAESFKKIFTDASVQMVTATARSVGALRRLQTIIGAGPAGTVDKLRQQATDLRNLLSRAGAQAPDAIRPIEEALKLVLARLRDEGPATAIGKLAAATQRSTAAIATSSQVLAGVIATLVPTARLFTQVMAEGFDKLKEQPVLDTLRGIGEAAARTFNIEIKSTGGEIKVDVQGTGESGSAIDEDEIREILDAALVDERKNMDERMQKLEDELRGK